MNNTEANTAFNEGQYAGVYPDGIENHYWTLARNRTLLSVVSSVLDRGNGLVLDVGCGRGITIDYLRRRGIEVLGCDLGTAPPICPDIAPFLKSGTDAMTLDASVKEQVKVVMLLDVLEHLPAPADFLSQLIDAFPNCHSVIITVPARMEVWSNYDVFNGHFKRYGFESSHELFEQTKFRLTKQTYLFRLLYPAAWALRLMNKDRDVQLKAPKGLSLIAHRIVSYWFWMEFCLFPSRMLGTSLLLVLSRR